MKTTPVLNSLLHTAYREKKDDDLTPLRVEKLLYFLHGWYMTVTGEALLSEPFFHGKYGPTLVSLDVYLAQYAGVPVADYIKEWDDTSAQLGPFFVNTGALPQFAEVLQKVWTEYSGYTTMQLSTMSHRPGSPWALTKPGDPISNTSIVADFLRQATANRERKNAQGAAPVPAVSAS